MTLDFTAVEAFRAVEAQRATSAIITKPEPEPLPRGAHEPYQARYGISHNVYYVRSIWARLARSLPRPSALLWHGA